VTFRWAFRSETSFRDLDRLKKKLTAAQPHPSPPQPNLYTPKNAKIKLP
jgi:hypothetical protein